MKKLSLLCTVMILSATTVGAFEVPKVPTVKISNPIKAVSAKSTASNFDKSAVKNQVQTISDSVDQINVALNQSVEALATVLANKDKVAALKASRDELLSKAKTKEKDAIIAKFDKDMEAALQESMQNADVKNNLKTLSSTQKALVGNCIYNLGVAGLSYTDIAIQAVSVANTIKANPSSVVFMGPELKTLAKFTTSLPSQAKSVAGLGINLTKVAIAGGVTVPKATKGSKIKTLSKADLDAIK